MAIECARRLLYDFGLTLRLPTRSVMRDEATGLLDRDDFLVALGDMIGGADVGKLALVVADVDSMNLVNDTHGRAAGDFLLATVGSRLRDCAPRNAVAGRVGGDKFAVTFTGANLEREVQTYLAYARMSVGIPAALGATILLPEASYATVTLGDKHGSADELLADAEAALIEVKGARRRSNPLGW